MKHTEKQSNLSDNSNWSGSLLFLTPPFLLVVLTLITYYKSLFYGFIFDDIPTIINYIHVRVFDPIGQFFANPRWISRVLNQFTYKYWQENPVPYRIINLSMHIIIGMLVFFVFYRLLSQAKQSSKLSTFLQKQAFAISLLTTALFLLHPVQTQTVTYITQMRLEGLAMLFLMGVVALFVYGVQIEQAAESSAFNRFIIFSYIVTAFSAGTKECIVVLPLLLLLVDWFFIAQGDVNQLKKRAIIHLGYWCVLFGVLAYMGIMRPHYIAQIATTPIKNNRGNLLTPVHGQEISSYFYALSQPKVIVHYLTLFFTPWRVCFDYDMRLSQGLFAFDVLVPLALLLLMAWGVFVVYKKEKTSPYLFAALWFFISILPRASIFPSTELVCDYKTYIASLGVLFGMALLFMQALYLVIERLASVFKKISDNHYKVSAAYSFIAVFSLFCAYASQQRNLVWASDEAFWHDAVMKAPTKARGFNNYATALWEKGDKLGAIAAFEQAIKLDTIYGEPHVNLAIIYQNEQNIDKALEHYRRAMEIGEGHPEMFHNLGVLHFTTNNYEVAAQCFREALALKPYYGRSLINLGRCLQILGKADEALVCYEQAMVSDYQDRDLYFLHGSLCYDQGLYDKATKSLERLDKRFMDTGFKLGSCYYMVHNYKEAAECFEIAVAQEPKNLMYQYNCAQAWLNSGQNYERALALFDECSGHEDELPYIPMQKSKCLFYLGLRDQAQSVLEHIIQSTENEFVKKDSEALLQELRKQT